MTAATGMIDLHCHILPGLDDGSPDMAVSLAMARLAAKDGITDTVATPHLFRGASNLTDFGMLGRKLKEFQAELERQAIPLAVHCGVEVRFSHNLIEEIRKHRKNIVLAGSSYMFIEFPFDYVYTGAREVFFEIMNEGLIPILAHPERITTFISHPERLFELVETGALVQLNAGSILGHYGSQVRETALLCLRLSMVHFIASDGHNTESRPPVLSEAARAAGSIVGPEAAAAMVRDNPRAVLEDKGLPYQPDPIHPQKPAEKHLRLKLPSFLRPKKAD